MRVVILASVVLSLLAASNLPALGPHEVLVLANEQSSNSVALAAEFMRLRGIPDLNLVLLRPFAPSGVVSTAVSPGDFTARIWEPAVRAMGDRGIGGHIQAWVYSVDFPVCVRTTPVLSITGLTFLRNRLPPEGAVRSGTYGSPLFAGPNSDRGAGHFPQTLDQFGEWLGDRMPLPGMMLGFTGPRGNTPAEVRECLARGCAADGSTPTGTVYFVTGSDIRSACRAWQFRPAVLELGRMGVRAVITNAFPVRRRDVAGLMMGAETVKPDGRNVYLPGCMAEHLTSAAAVFDGDHQTKLTAWIKAGATASAGTVTEPYSIWTKFPHARFFVHYAAGCTVLESFYQSIRCPLEILPVGDPLASPWAPAASVRIDGLEGDTVAGAVRLTASVAAMPGHHYGRFVWLLDGRIAGGDRAFIVDPASIEPGRHRLRAVAYRTGMVRNQVFAEREIRVVRPGAPGTP